MGKQTSLRGESNLRGDLVLVEVREVLKLRENVLSSGKGLWLTSLPLLSLLSSWGTDRETETLTGE